MDPKNAHFPENMESGKSMQRESEVSLTASEISRRYKLGAPPKNPLDAISRPPKQNEYHEKRSGLQNVKEEELNIYFSSPFAQKNSGLSPRRSHLHNNNSDNQMQQPNNAGATTTTMQQETECRAAPSAEPKIEDNLNSGNEGGYCATCPNCAAKILLVPEVENNNCANTLTHQTS